MHDSPVKLNVTLAERLLVQNTLSPLSLVQISESEVGGEKVVFESFARTVTVAACALRSRREEKQRVDTVHAVRSTERGRFIDGERARDPSRCS